MRLKLSTLLICALLGACSNPSTDTVATTPSQSQPAATENPLLSAEWSTRFGAIPFDKIQLDHLAPALDSAMAQQLAAVEVIVGSTEAPTVANTLEPLERSSAAMRRVSAVYSVFSGNLSSEAVRQLESTYAPRLAAHQNRILLDPRLYARIKALSADASLQESNPEAARLAEQTLKRFVRAGAALDEAQRAEVAGLTEREAALMTQFNQNLLRDTEAFKLELDESDLAGLSESVRATAAQAGKDAGKPGKYLFGLQRPDFEAFVSQSQRRDLREQLYRAFINRGDNGDANDNKAIIAELVALRAQRAQLLGYASHAELITADSMAQTPQAALGLLERVWAPAVLQAKADAAVLQKMMDAEGSGQLEGWDWRYYAEQVRRERYALDPAEVAPYFALDNMLLAAFAVSERLFGLRFAERTDIPVYHPDVRVFEVLDGLDGHVGLLYLDYFARSGKRSGAWMASYRPQNRLDGDVRPQVVNNLNIPKPPAGQPALISVTEATTLFHELGHALHGLLSDVKYPSLSGTAVPRDYVEFPAQFMEHYVLQPQMLKEFARHVHSDEPMPDALIEQLLNSRKFDQGFATVEFVASALVDQRFHALSPEQAKDLDAARFEREVMAELGALPQIPMRHRSPHFSHVFGGGYSAAYYAYMWSEVLDADGFAAFEETGDIFDPETAARLRDRVYTRGNTLDWMRAYTEFRGREPAVEPLLRGRGLLPGQ